MQIEYEIERKFLVKYLPVIEVAATNFERYYIFTDERIELRLQKVGDNYEIEHLERKSEHGRSSSKFPISQGEFNILKTLGKNVIHRDSYFYQNNPNITIKIYHGDYEGLVRVEVEFGNEIEARDFKPLEWFGAEITDLKIGQDSTLIQLNKDQFSEELLRLTQS